MMTYLITFLLIEGAEEEEEEVEEEIGPATTMQFHHKPALHAFTELDVYADTAEKPCSYKCAIKTNQHRCTAFYVDSVNQCHCGKLGPFAVRPKTEDIISVNKYCSPYGYSGIMF